MFFIENFNQLTKINILDEKMAYMLNVQLLFLCEFLLFPTCERYLLILLFLFSLKKTNFAS